MKTVEEKLDELTRRGVQLPERIGQIFKCPHCTFVADDVDEMIDHLLMACDLAYNDPPPKFR